MSEKIFIKELLEGVEVECKTIEKVFNLKNGHILNNAIQHVHKNGIKGKLFPANSIIMATTATIGIHALITVNYMRNQQFTNFTIKDEFCKRLNIKFVYYYFFILDYIAKQSVNVSSFPSVQMAQLKQWYFSIPPLNIQNEIVLILDTFTELTAELCARKKQYNYYRDKLLSFEDGEIEWKRLEDVLVRKKGTKITASQMKDLHKDNALLKIFAGGKTIAFLNFEDIPEKDINKKPSIIVKSRGVIEFEYYNKPFSHKNEMWSYHSKKNNINIKFFYYFLKTQEDRLRKKAINMGAFPQIAIPDTEKIKIPIPPLEKQQKIVSILDKFDTLTNSISEGLPREIELRQKQYEYYKNLLLTFPKESVS